MNGNDLRSEPVACRSCIVRPPTYSRCRKVEPPTISRNLSNFVASFMACPFLLAGMQSRLLRKDAARRWLPADNEVSLANHLVENALKTGGLLSRNRPAQLNPTYPYTSLLVSRP